jgi:hypothetical protein
MLFFKLLYCIDKRKDLLLTVLPNAKKYFAICSEIKYKVSISEFTDYVLQYIWIQQIRGNDTKLMYCLVHLKNYSLESIATESLRKYQTTPHSLS